MFTEESSNESMPLYEYNSQIESVLQHPEIITKHKQEKSLGGEYESL